MATTKTTVETNVEAPAQKKERKRTPELQDKNGNVLRGLKWPLPKSVVFSLEDSIGMAEDGSSARAKVKIAKGQFLSVDYYYAYMAARYKMWAQKYAALAKDAKDMPEKFRKARNISAARAAKQKLDALQAPEMQAKLAEKLGVDSAAVQALLAELLA